MSQRVVVELEIPGYLARFTLPEEVPLRLQSLLDRQDGGELLRESERVEAEGLADLADLLALLKLRAGRAAGDERR